MEHIQITSTVYKHIKGIALTTVHFSIYGYSLLMNKCSFNILSLTYQVNNCSPYYSYTVLTNEQMFTIITIISKE